MSEPLSALWSARSIAVIGASNSPSALGRLPVEFLQRYGYKGTIVPVRPDGADVLGLPSVRSLAEAQEPVDLAMILLSAERVPGAVDDCVAAGVPVAIVCSSGFAETGASGAATQADLVERARRGGTRLVGPNCIGSVGVANRQVTSFSPLFSGERTELVDGSLGFVSQSGALGYGAVSLAYERGLGLGWVVNTGNEADVNAFEVMKALAAEPGCNGLLAYVESLDDIEGLRAVASTGLPVAVLKAGRSEAGARAAASHTGALAAGDRVVDAALRQLGIARATDVEELLDIGDAFAQPRRPTGPRVAVVTTSGGSGILAADAIEQHGLELATLSDETVAVLDEIVPAFGSTANPVDVTATVMSNPDLFDRALSALVDDDGVDIVVACFCVLTGKDVDDVVTGLDGAAQRSGKPVLVARTGADHLAPTASRRLRAAGIPAYPTPARAVRAAAALHQVSTRRPADDATTGSRDPIARDTPVGSSPRRDAGESEVKALLQETGLPVPAGRLVTSPHDARAAVESVGGRAVLKAVVPGLTHKTEAGGVLLDIDPDSAPEAFERLASLGGDVLVEELVPGGVEALVGVAASPLGPVLTLGPGGVLTELVDDVALRLLPVTTRDVEEMVDQTRLAKLLAGLRGAPPADRAALVETVVRLAAVVGSWPAGFSLDLNPVTVLPDGEGVRILDAAYIAPEDT
ncbi:MAG TPA: acetate--CoA ligase family protein [Nocardioidaceae bacterium]|nr:acetate--CoA ligase family protein [Nocardioidaceae bacterium]